MGSSYTSHIYSKCTVNQCILQMNRYFVNKLEVGGYIFNQDSAVKSPRWRQVSNLRPSKPDLLSFEAAQTLRTIDHPNLRKRNWQEIKA